MNKEELDKIYDDRLEELYQLAVKEKEPATAMVILDKIRVMKLHLMKPAKEPNDTSV
ncbi:hypothetical protein LCGC14_0643750 [marine sediment metagenome]|uniref:Uncharacterized protein n=1 Tax=marine sediment metagenome TaxID=412755 RepID=A0A0F9R3J8_9ZZZZ